MTIITISSMSAAASRHADAAVYGDSKRRKQAATALRYAPLTRLHGQDRLAG